MCQDTFKPNQLAAIKKLEAALQSCKRAGLVLAGIDNTLHATVRDDDFADQARSQSSCEAMLERECEGHPLHCTVKDYGCYLDSGAT